MTVLVQGQIAGPRSRLSAVAVLAAVTLLALTEHPATAAADPGTLTPQPPEVQIVLDEPLPPTVYEDSPTTLSGSISNGRADKLIVLRTQIGGDWSRVGSTHTDEAGRFAFDYTPVDPGDVVVEAVHPLPHGRSRSNQQHVMVLDRRVFLSTQSAYHTFGNVVMTGRTRPLRAHRRIVIQHQVDGQWVSGAAGYTDPTGRYAIPIRNNMPGPWIVRAWWGGINPPGGTLEVSLAHRFVVNAILHPVVTAVTRKQLGGSFHAGCPVGPALLRNDEVTFSTFGPFVERGTIVVRDSIVTRVNAILREGLDHGYPIRRMIPAAHYNGSDVAMMRDDDTSGFNCRTVTGDPTQLSPHSYGIAIDVDTVENPYQDVHGTWWPKHFGEQFRNRSIHRPGMLYGGSVVTRGFTGRGFEWGGGWSHPDYQHFDTFSGGPRKRAARVAGPLRARVMPPASAFGAGWRRYPDPGGPEAGWLGNASFVHARGGRAAAHGALPLGCTSRSPILPAARFALQGAYQSASGAPGQAVVLLFAEPRLATRYFDGLETAVLRCSHGGGTPYLHVRVLSATPTSYTGVRVYGRDGTWQEQASRVGARVTVMLARR